jgi:iron complex transport system ATP-binding protein
MVRLETRALTLHIGTRTLCRDVTVAFAAGENWAILGANGSGKTTLLHTLAGLRTPDRGEILLDEMPVTQVAPRQRARRIGVLFQEYDSGFPATVLDLVLTGRHPHLSQLEWETAADRQLADAALAELGLTAMADRALATLSGGERRRAEIAALLVQNAPVMLLDEPINHLDLRHQTEILRQIAARAGRPEHLNLFVLHDVNAALRHCSHGMLLFADGGCLAGPIDEVATRVNLETLYGCPLREFSHSGYRVFLPI